MSTDATIREAGQIRERAMEACILLARQIAMGEDKDPSEIANKCRDVGWDPDVEFAALVRSLKHRAELRIGIAGREAIENEMATIEARCNELAATLEAARRDYEQAVSPLSARHEILRKRLAEVRTLPADLSRSCPCPKLNAEKRRLEIEGQQLQEQLRDAQDNVRRLQGQLDNLNPAVDDLAPCKRALGRAELTLAEIAEKVKKNHAASEANWRARIEF